MPDSVVSGGPLGRVGTSDATTLMMLSEWEEDTSHHMATGYGRLASPAPGAWTALLHRAVSPTALTNDKLVMHFKHILKWHYVSCQTSLGLHTLAKRRLKLSENLPTL